MAAVYKEQRPGRKTDANKKDKGKEKIYPEVDMVTPNDDPDFALQESQRKISSPFDGHHHEKATHHPTRPSQPVKEKRRYRGSIGNSP